MYRSKKAAAYPSNEKPLEILIIPVSSRKNKRRFLKIKKPMKISNILYAYYQNDSPSGRIARAYSLQPRPHDLRGDRVVQRGEDPGKGCENLQDSWRLSACALAVCLWR